MDEFENIDLYELLDIPSSAEKAHIKKAFRKKALSCHPDKNPDNPDAAKLFHQLSKAQDLLLNDVARGIYDRKLKAKEAARLRNRELNEERKRFKQKLEAQESLAKLKKEDDLKQKKIALLREQARREQEEENIKAEELRQQRLRENYLSFCRIKVSWKADKEDTTNGGYNEKIMNEIFSPYGEIEAMVINSKKNGSAIIEFNNPDAAKHAKSMVTGLPSNPLKLKILGTANAEARKKQLDSMIYQRKTDNQVKKDSSFPCTFTSSQPVWTPNSQSLDDFEESVLQALRKTQEKKNSLANETEEKTQKSMNTVPEEGQRSRPLFPCFSTSNEKTQYSSPIFPCFSSSQNSFSPR